MIFRWLITNIFPSQYLFSNAFTRSPAIITYSYTRACAYKGLIALEIDVFRGIYKLSLNLDEEFFPLLLLGFLQGAERGC